MLHRKGFWAEHLKSSKEDICRAHQIYNPGDRWSWIIELGQDGWQSGKTGTSQENVIFSVFPGDIVLKLMSYLSRVWDEPSILKSSQKYHGKWACPPLSLPGTGQETLHGRRHLETLTDSTRRGKKRWISQNSMGIWLWKHCGIFSRVIWSFYLEFKNKNPGERVLFW